MSNWLTALMTNLVFAAPVLIVYAIAAVMAIARWKRHPTVSMLVVLATVMSTAFRLVSTFIFAWLPMNSDRLGWNPVSIGQVLSAISLVTTVIQSLALAMIFAAVFIGRDGDRANLTQPQHGSTKFAKD